MPADGAGATDEVRYRIDADDLLVGFNAAWDNGASNLVGRRACPRGRAVP